MSSLKDAILLNGRSPVLRVSWSESDLAELRKEGRRQIERASAQKPAQFDLHLTWPRLFDLVTDDVLLSALGEVFGEDSFQLVETRLYPKPPHTEANWHIDLRQLEYYEPSLLRTDSEVLHSVTTWLAVDDVPVEMGALQMIHYKYTDLNKLVRVKRNQPAPQYRDLCAELVARCRAHVETLPMKAGEFCMFDPRNLHTGAANRTNRFRLGLVMRYCASHVKVDPRFSKKGDLHITQIREGKVVRPVMR